MEASLTTSMEETTIVIYSTEQENLGQTSSIALWKVSAT